MLFYLLSDLEDMELSHLDTSFYPVSYKTISLEDVGNIYQYALGNIQQMYSSYQMVFNAVHNDSVLLNVPPIGKVTPEFYL